MAVLGTVQCIINNILSALIVAAGLQHEAINNLVCSDSPALRHHSPWSWLMPSVLQQANCQALICDVQRYRYAILSSVKLTKQVCPNRS